MRLLVTADLHYNHEKSRALAEQVIDEMNGVEADVLLVVGDTATSEGDALERCLGRFEFSGPRLFVAGNHELWTRGEDSHRLHHEDLPRRVRALGWHWLEAEPFTLGGISIVGSIGWYDYSFASERLGIPRRFYAQKVSPGAAAYLKREELLERSDDIPPAAMEVVARWNDARYVKLHRSDEAFLAEVTGRLRGQLQSLRHHPHVVAAVHHRPFREMLPPAGHTQRDFAHAYLGAESLGRLLLQFPNVRTVLCGHSHFPARARLGHLDAINIGAGYRKKEYLLLELPEAGRA